MHRNLDLSLRSPELISMAQLKGFSRGCVGPIFNILQKIMEKYNLGHKNIYNVDEMRIQQHKNLFKKL